jgi:predicted flap endonuclease-1-like 5' DNA nuclease
MNAVSTGGKNMTRIQEIEGIGSAYEDKLAEVGIETVEVLLERGASPKGRKQLVESTGISAKLILKWVNRADLARVKGVGEEYADLLELAGVDTVPELAQRNPQNLHQKMVELNDEKNVVRRTPSLSAVEDWVSQAKVLGRVITY